MNLNKGEIQKEYIYIWIYTHTNIYRNIYLYMYTYIYMKLFFFETFFFFLKQRAQGACNYSSHTWTPYTPRFLSHFSSLKYTSPVEVQGPSALESLGVLVKYRTYSCFQTELGSPGPQMLNLNKLPGWSLRTTASSFFFRIWLKVLFPWSIIFT